MDENNDKNNSNKTETRIYMYIKIKSQMLVTIVMIVVIAIIMIKIHTFFLYSSWTSAIDSLGELRLDKSDDDPGCIGRIGNPCEAGLVPLAACCGRNEKPLISWVEWLSGVAASSDTKVAVSEDELGAMVVVVAV